MADFISNLWESVFTSGPTPTLLLATNATFAALQALLFALLLATYSMHFAVLSFLCGGLWWAINWFATELQAVKREEEEAKKRTAASEGGKKSLAEELDGKGGDSADDEGESTEVEGGNGLEHSKSSLSLSGFEEGDAVGAAASAAAISEDVTDGARQRIVQAKQGGKGVDYSGEVSTDSEWEKVDGGK